MGGAVIGGQLCPRNLSFDLTPFGKAPRRPGVTKPPTHINRHAKPLPVNDSENILPDDEAFAASQWMGGLLYSTTKHEYGWFPTPFHQLLCEIAHRIIEGKDGWDRVVLSTPPQHGKSESMSRGLPAMFLGLNPKLNVILTSYGAEFAQEWGAKVRDTLITYGEQIFGLRVNPRSRSNKRFSILHEEGGTWYPGGKMITAGARGRITGEGAHLILIDDPIKNDEQASSPVYQDKIWNWYQATLRSRIRKGTRILLTMTRWHENDLAGKLIAESEAGTGEKFIVINLPAIAEEDEDWSCWGVNHIRRKGEALCPELHDLDEMTKTRAAVGSYWWAALYMGRPNPDSGDIFQRKWFKSWGYEAKNRFYNPETSRWEYELYPLPRRFDLVCISWDMAFKDKKSSSFVVGQVWGLLGVDHYLLDQVKGQWNFPTTLEWVRKVAEAYPIAYHTLIEDKANGTAVETILHDEITGIVMIEPGRLFKTARARATSSIAESGCAYVPGRGVETKLGHDIPWVWGDAPRSNDGNFTPGSRGYIEEHVSFPNGMFDDQVDAGSQAQAWLREKQMAGAIPMLSTLASQRMSIRAAPEPPSIERVGGLALPPPRRANVAVKEI
jgi:predicted phage terminase large subunit-like protein